MVCFVFIFVERYYYIYSTFKVKSSFVRIVVYFEINLFENIWEIPMTPTVHKFGVSIVHQILINSEGSDSLKWVVVYSSVTFHTNAYHDRLAPYLCCDGVGCHVMCLQHGFNVWQHSSQVSLLQADTVAMRPQMLTATLTAPPPPIELFKNDEYSLSFLQISIRSRKLFHYILKA